MDTKKFKPTQSGGDSFFIRPQKKHVTPGKSSEQQKLDTEEKTKKPFDKKKWRLKKYSNKYKVDKWEDERKKKVLYRYNKEMKNEKQGFDVQKIYAEDDNEADESVGDKTSSQEVDNDKGKHKLNVHERLLQLKQEKNKKKEEAIERKAKKEEAIKLYKQKKAEKFKKLNKKTRKGQPIMKDRLEMLLEKIQSSCQNDS